MSVTDRIRKLLARFDGAAGGTTTLPPGRRSQLGRTEVPVIGVAPTGQPSAVEVGNGRRGLLFLTSTCKPCRALWDDAAEAAGLPVTLVTPSPSTESVRRVSALSPPRVDVIMSSEGWNEYAVTKAPWLLVVDRGAVVVDEEAPHCWADIARRVAPS